MGYPLQILFTVPKPIHLRGLQVRCDDVYITRDALAPSEPAVKSILMGHLHYRDWGSTKAKRCTRDIYVNYPTSNSVVRGEEEVLPFGLMLSRPKEKKDWPRALE